MKIFKMKCGAEVMLDDEDYDKLPKTGWYLSGKYHEHGALRKTQYAVHDTYGRMHRYILGLTKEDKNLLVDHIDRNGLNNTRVNLRIIDCSTNKRNQNLIQNNQFNFTGIHIEYDKNKDYFRFRASYQIDKSSQRFKSFSFSSYNSPQDALKAAILYRIERMRENGYIVDERSTTIEQEILNNSNCDIENLLGINLYKIILSKVGSNESKWV